MPYRSLLAITLSIVLLTACATGGYDPERDPYKDPQLAYAEGMDETDMSNRASILDGVFERMRDRPESVDEERLAELEAAVERLEQERARAEADFAGLRHGVGLLIDAEHADQAETAFGRAASGKPALISNTAATRAALADAGCDPRGLLDCAETVAVYPGLRLIVELQIAGDGTATWRTTDTALGWQTREQQLQLPTSNGAIPDIALDSLAEQALRTALDRTRAAPWQARVFSTDEAVAINAGRAHGLNTGDTLIVTTPGRVLRSPAGQPAGWLPGDTVGRVQVESLAGERVATVRVLDGERPTPEHILIKE